MISLTSKFIDDLLALEPADTRRVLAALSKLENDPRHPSLQTKKMEGCDFYEVRASQELRVIADLFSGDPVCCIADHHDAALRRATRITRPRSRGLGEREAAYEARYLNVSSALDHLSDDDLRSEYHVPDEWLQLVRSCPSSEALLRCGIDEVLGVGLALRLAAEIAIGVSGFRGVQIVRGDLILRAINDFRTADVLDRVILVTPEFDALARSREFAGFTDLLRTRRPRTLVITRSPHASDPIRMLELLSKIPGTEVLTNDSVNTQVVACLAPTPWGFAGLGSGTGASLDEKPVGVFVPSRVGEDRAIKQLAALADEMSTALDTRVYPAPRS
jgi:mRNA interferase RelE/StbE